MPAGFNASSCLSMNGFRKRVEALLRAHPDLPYLISYNNIRNLKFINESLGWAAGDELLRFWANTAGKTLTDEEAMCRVSGDRMAFLRVIADEEKIKRDEAEVYEPLRNYFVDRGYETRVQISAGVYILTPEDYQNINVDRILDHARMTEKRVRETHKEGYEIYNPDQWERGKRVADIVGHLPLALRGGELQVWYQPQVDYETGEIIGAEALCRWNHAKLGWLRPSEFIATLEEAGLIYDRRRSVFTCSFYGKYLHVLTEIPLCVLLRSPRTQGVWQWHHRAVCRQLCRPTL